MKNGYGEVGAKLIVTSRRKTTDFIAICIFSISAIPLRVYYGTARGLGIVAYSVSTSGEITSPARTLIPSSEDLEGLTFDWINSKIYYATTNRIYAANADGTGVQTVFVSTQCEPTLF